MPLVDHANSYVTLDEANTYFGSRLYTTNWDRASDSDKQKALLMAMKKLFLLNWVGEKSDDNQDLDWPRKYTGISGVEDDEVPQIIKDGQCEYALSILRGDTTDSTNKEALIVSSKMGDSSVEYDRSSTIASDPFSYAKEIMAGYFDSSISVMR